MRRFISTTLAAALAVLSCVSFAGAEQVELSSPLEGYARPGKAAAVHISAEGLSSSRLMVFGDAVVPVQLPATAGRVEATVPVLTQGQPPDGLQWQSGNASGTAALQVRTLTPDERLIAMAGDVPDVDELAAELFAGKRAIVVTLDAARPRLLWPPQAYEAADAVLLDLPSAARVDESQLRVMLAAGTIVAIRSPVRPVGQWPWQQQGAWWVLRHTPVGPHGGANVEAYAPTYAWDRSWPEAERRKLLLLSALGAMLLIAATLWRGRAGFIAAVAVCICATAAAAFYVLSLKPAVFAGGAVVVWDGSLAQHDRWSYASAFRDTHLSVDAIDHTRPILGSRRQLQSLGLTLTCDPSGAPERYDFTLAAKNTLAFVTRSVTPTPPADFPPGGDVRMNLIADKLYPGRMSEQGATPPDDSHGEWWGTVVMRR